jgi:DNA repair exonuclease SbcCD ATPase subunit
MSEKNIPVQEQEDGSALIALEQEADPFAVKEEGEEPEEKAEGGEVEASEEEGDENHEDSEEDEDEDEREKIREARREERKLKKELAKQRDASAKHKISALERRNEELARRLAAVESTASSFQFAQVDKAIEDEATRVEYAKMKLLQASQAGDAEGQVEYLEQLQDSKQRLAQVQAYKKQQLENAKRPKQNVPNPVAAEVQRNATEWLGKNKWYDPQARDTDSRIAKVIDQELAADGWDPADPEYWDELDNRLTARLPHRYAAKTGTTTKRAGPTASGRTANPTGKSANTVTLSRERVNAIKDAGAWDDPVKRNKMIKAYNAYDKANKG